MKDKVERNKAVVRRYFECFAAGDIDGAMTLFAEDAVIKSMSRTPLEPEYRGRGAIAQAASMVRTAFPEGLEMIVHSMTPVEDRVAVEVESRGRHRTGKVYNNRYHLLWVLKDSLFIEMREYFDSEHVVDVIFDGVRRAR